MKASIILVVVAFTAGQQQFQQRREFNTAVRLAGQGFFQGGSRRTISNFNNSNNNNNYNNQQQGSPFFSESNAFQSQDTRAFQNENQFKQNTFTSSDAQRQNQQNTNSLTSLTGDNKDQFQSTGLASSSPQINNEVRFESNFNQQNSHNQFQTGNRLTPINIQLTPSAGTQATSSQQTIVNPSRTTSTQQNNQFQQSNFNAQTFASNSQSSTNNQFSSGNQFQSSSRSSSSELNDAIDGVFEPLNLPSGASRMLGRIDTSFSCVDRPYGYYADQENSCRVFHICNPALFIDGEIQTFQYSFMCGEGTVFDQNEMICKNEFDATPCQEASNYYFRNEQFGRLEDRSI